MSWLMVNLIGTLLTTHSSAPSISKTQTELWACSFHPFSFFLFHLLSPTPPLHSEHRISKHNFIQHPYSFISSHPYTIFFSYFLATGWTITMINLPTSVLPLPEYIHQNVHENKMEQITELNYTEPMKESTLLLCFFLIFSYFKRLCIWMLYRNIFGPFVYGL